MSFEEYLRQLEAAIPPSPHIRLLRIESRRFSNVHGRVKVVIAFDDGSELHLAQVVNLERADPVGKYGYHYQDGKGDLIFRYDNKPHFRDLPTYPDHKHMPDGVVPAHRPGIQDVVAEALRHVTGQSTR